MFVFECEREVWMKLWMSNKWPSLLLGWNSQIANKSKLCVCEWAKGLCASSHLLFSFSLTFLSSHRQICRELIRKRKEQLFSLSLLTFFSSQTTSKRFSFSIITTTTTTIIIIIKLALHLCALTLSVRSLAAAFSMLNTHTKLNRLSRCMIKSKQPTATTTTTIHVYISISHLYSRFECKFPPLFSFILAKKNSQLVNSIQLSLNTNNNQRAKIKIKQKKERKELKVWCHNSLCFFDETLFFAWI